jgi:predicted transcriptional regulator
MEVVVKNLLTIKNYALRSGVTPSYIYKLVKEKKMEIVNIDGVKFVDKVAFPTIPSKK